MCAHGRQSLVAMPGEPLPSPPVGRLAMGVLVLARLRSQRFAVSGTVTGERGAAGVPGRL